MTLTFLELYNSAASQDWSMYDSGAVSDDEFENSLVIALNKAVTEILHSYPFSFRQRTHVIITMPGINSYNIPPGLIMKDNLNNYCVKLNTKILKYLVNPNTLSKKEGIPEGFYTKGNRIVLYPTPTQKSIVSIDYYTLAIGTNEDDNDIYYIQSKNDVISVPEHLEELFKQAVISRCMLKTISSENDENYSAYKKQSEIAYRLLVKYSKGVEQNKSVKI